MHSESVSFVTIVPASPEQFPRLAQNAGACTFYRRNGFEIEKEQIDEATGAREQVMVWRRP